MPNVISRDETIGLYLPKERSDYLPLTPFNSLKKRHEHKNHRTGISDK